MNIERKNLRVLMCVCITMPYKYISLMNDAHNVAGNTHMRSKIYWKFYHNICIYTMEDVIYELICRYISNIIYTLY